MTFDPHMLTVAMATLGVGWLMAYAGIQKSALELRKRRRVCPSCGRTIQGHSCSSCV
jgi:exosome complex RNA-binding protein Csl4